MRLLPRLLPLAAFPALLAFGLGAAQPALGQGGDPAQIIRDRREGLRAIGQHMEAMQALAQSRGDTRQALERVDAIQAFFRTFTDRFPPNTQQGDTRALPAIWTDQAGFQRAAAAMTPVLAQLRQAAASGDPTAFGNAVRETGATCGNCHRAYRAR
ncbi:MAG: cytochrome c [Rhodovarius sp.]|nr:cytochrome c [Rhodovarius sp.]MCX7932577.1 cytochrome c [Rhodovarius sp.]MDW8313592.1 cytochrome c [Rhodovarius sp.]